MFYQVSHSAKIKFREVGGGFRHRRATLRKRTVVGSRAMRNFWRRWSSYVGIKPGISKHAFSNSNFIFATRHGKGVAAEGCFQRVLNASVKELIIDSDSLGTFSGEVERPGSMVDALREKVRLARAATKERFIMTSEGSFNSASSMGLFAQGVEMLMVHDALTGVEILEQHISLDTNYATEFLKERETLPRFLERISFGTHALVLYPEGLPIQGNVCKGITEKEEAHTVFDLCLQRSPVSAVVAMSDMRAHLNPTRMKSITYCCELLAQRLSTHCPRCGSGGFGLVGSVPGLPCRECALPTQRARAERHSCPFCEESVEMPRSDGKTAADPVECEWCNP